MKKVLIISNLYHSSPRIPGISVHLSEFGWEPVILTPSLKNDYKNRLGLPDGFYEKVRVAETAYKGDIFWFWRKVFKFLGFNRKESILNQVKEKTGSADRRSAIDKLFLFYTAFFGYPDEEKKWKKIAVKSAEKILEKEKFDAILSSSSPVISHIIAEKMAKKYKIPWIADLRDLWTQNHNYPFPWWRRIFEEKLEKKTLKSADFLVTVSPTWSERLKKLHKDKKTEFITNGFNPEEMNEKQSSLTDKFTITYAGQLYERRQDLDGFFRSLKELVSEKSIEPQDVEVRFYGGKSAWLEKKIEDFSLSGIIKINERVSRKEIIQKQNESQILLLICWEGEKGWYPLKLFGYLAAQRPILAVGGSGKDAIESLIEETKSGKYCKSSEEVKQSIKEWYSEYKNKKEVSYEGNLEQIRKYSYKEKAREFAFLLDRTQS